MLRAVALLGATCCACSADVQAPVLPHQLLSPERIWRQSCCIRCSALS